MLLWQNVMPLKIRYFLRPHRQDRVLMESCRSAIYSVLKFENERNGVNKVYVCDFTCQAVKDAVDATMISVERYSLGPDLRCREFILSHELKNCVFIMQMTFGLPSFKLDFLKKIKEKGAFVIADCALSAGTNSACYQAALQYCDVAVHSYECSKSLSYGWGGEISDFTLDCRFKRLFEQHPPARINLVQDILRLLQVAYSKKFLTKDNKFANFIRKGLTLLGVFRRSSSSSRSSSLGLRCGVLTERWIHNTEMYYANHFFILQKKIQIIDQIVSEFNLSTIYKCTVGVVSPRYPIFIDKKSEVIFHEIFNKYGVEVGRWFDTSPYSGVSFRFGDDSNLVCLNLPLMLADNPEILRVCLNEFTVHAS